MKVKNLQLVRKLDFKFDSIALVISLFLFSANCFSQSTKTIFDEVAVRDKITIESNLPTSLDIHINGTVTTNNTSDRYTLNGKNENIRLSILKDLEIETWEKNVVRQETKVTIKGKSKQEEIELMDKLQLSLKEKASKRVVIDCNLNISKFKMVNGFFRAEECELVLSNGKSYQVEYLELETKLFIPKASDLVLKGYNYSTIRLGELEGNVDLDLQYAEVYGTSVLKLKANLGWCYNVMFDKVAFADISAFNSYIKINSLGGAGIGMQSLKGANLLTDLYNKTSNSSQTKYEFGVVGLLEIFSSANDEFIIGELGFLNMKNTNYSTVKANRLNDSMIIDANSTDIQIDKVVKNFTTIDVQNRLSEIRMVFEEGASYTIEVDEMSYFEFDPDKSVMKLKNRGTEGKVYYQKGMKGEGGKITLNCDKCKFDIR